ncbi:MAG: hypothetical protein HQK77_19375, partial [Desulfobacterales bacterium]|nr:hypothetical protein [Desulfobacterales bacterium]
MGVDPSGNTLFTSIVSTVVNNSQDNSIIPKTLKENIVTGEAHEEAYEEAYFNYLKNNINKEADLKFTDLWDIFKEEGRSATKFVKGGISIIKSKTIMVICRTTADS